MGKKFFIFCLSALAVSGMLFVACDDDDDEVVNNEEPDTPVVVADPTLEVSTFSVTAVSAGGTYSFTYVLRNSVEDGALSCSADADWVTGISVNQGDSTVSFEVEENEKTEERSCNVTLSYTWSDGSLSQVVAVAQMAADDPMEAYVDLIGTYHSDGSEYTGAPGAAETSKNYGSQKWVTRIHWNADKTGLLMEGVTKNSNREHSSDYNETYMAVLEPDFSGDTLKLYIRNQQVEATNGTYPRGYCAMSHCIFNYQRTFDLDYDRDFFLYWYEEQGIWTSILHAEDGDPGNVDGSGNPNDNYNWYRENNELGVFYCYWKAFPTEVGSIYESAYKWEMEKVSDDDEIEDGYTND